MNASPTSSPSGMQPTCCGDRSPAERREFEEHLASCLPASRPSRNLLPTPGLLAQVSPADAAMESAGAS
jgi:hypothetical protein